MTTILQRPGLHRQMVSETTQAVAWLRIEAVVCPFAEGQQERFLEETLHSIWPSLTRLALHRWF